MPKAYLEVLDNYPAFLRTKDLVELGLFKNEAVLCQARNYGRSPDYIKVGQKVLYPKASLVEFLEDNFKKGNA